MSYALQETRYTEQLHSGNQATRQGLAVHIHIAHEWCEHQIWEPVGRPTRRLFVGAAAVTEDKGHTPADLLGLLVLYPTPPSLLHQVHDAQNGVLMIERGFSWYKHQGLKGWEGAERSIISLGGWCYFCSYEAVDCLRRTHRYVLKNKKESKTTWFEHLRLFIMGIPEIRWLLSRTSHNGRTEGTEEGTQR